METLVIALAALLASGLTLFSGFGLGTLLMPVIALFFPVDVAIGITAVVHFANNLFKLGIMGWGADKKTVVRFGVPAVAAAFAGAWLLGQLNSLPPLLEYSLGGKMMAISPIKLVIGILILVFAALELSPAFAAVAIDPKYLALGGCISGFFGGLSGNQGAFRSMFLLKTGLSKEQFIATGVVVAAMVDLTRLLVYGRDLTAAGRSIDWVLVAVTCGSAFVGAAVSARMARSMTFRSIQLIIAVLLIIVALGLIGGVL